MATIVAKYITYCFISLSSNNSYISVLTIWINDYRGSSRNTEKNCKSEISTIILNMSIFATNLTTCPKNFVFLTLPRNISFSRNDEIQGVINHLIFNWTPTVCNNILSRHFFLSLEKCFTCCDIPAPPYDATFLCQYVLFQLLFYIFIIKDEKL